MVILLREVTLPFSVLLPFSMGTCLKGSKFFLLRVDPILEGFIIQEYKQKVKMVLSRVQIGSQNIAIKNTNRKSNSCFQGYRQTVKMLLSRVQVGSQNVAFLCKKRLGSLVDLAC